LSGRGTIEHIGQPYLRFVEGADAVRTHPDANARFLGPNADDKRGVPLVVDSEGSGTGSRSLDWDLSWGQNGVLIHKSINSYN
jgi:hypothetical protein